MADARTRIARVHASGSEDDGVRPTPTSEDQALAAFSPPPPGHKDWLNVELQGLDPW